MTDTWSDAELEPYRTLFGLGLPDAVMSAHVTNRTLDRDLPASLSAATIDGLLRTDLGWDGPVITDDMGAVAITSRYDRTEAIALAIEAGNDVLTFANQATHEADLAEQVVETIVSHVRSGRISPDRLQRVGRSPGTLGAAARGLTAASQSPEIEQLVLRLARQQVDEAALHGLALEQRPMDLAGDGHLHAQPVGQGQRGIHGVGALRGARQGPLELCPRRGPWPAPRRDGGCATAASRRWR